MNESENTAKTSEVFGVALSSNRTFHDNFVGNSFKLAALLTVVIGWFISSPAARDFLNSAHPYLWIAILAFTFFATIVTFINFRSASNISRKLYQNMIDLNYMDKCYFEHHKISSRLFYSMLLLIMVLYLILLTALIYVRT